MNHTVIDQGSPNSLIRYFQNNPEVALELMTRLYGLRELFVPNDPYYPPVALTDDVLKKIFKLHPEAEEICKRMEPNE